MKALIVEDEILEQRALVHLLKTKFPDFNEITTAADGTQAVVAAVRMRPDLILMDINLPLLDGIGAIGKIREAIPECKIIMVSAYSDYEHLRESIRHQALDYIVKPYSVETFCESVARVMRKSDKEYNRYGKSGTVQQIKDYLESCYMQDIRLQDVANEVNMDKSYLGRLFRETCGITIMGYLRKYRLEQAKELLLAGMGASEVALQTGFVDPAYFGKIFKQEFGVSPAKYRTLQQDIKRT